MKTLAKQLAKSIDLHVETTDIDVDIKVGGNQIHIELEGDVPQKDIDYQLSGPVLLVKVYGNHGNATAQQFGNGGSFVQYASASGNARIVQGRNIQIINGQVFGDNVTVTEVERRVLHITVPAGTSVWASSQTAALRVSGDAPSVKLQADTGSIKVDGSAATIDAVAKSGSIKVDRLDGTAYLRTTTGSIKVGSFHSGDLRAVANTGSVKIDVSPGATGRITAQANTGSVKVSGSRGTSVRVEAETGTGSKKIS